MVKVTAVAIQFAANKEVYLPGDEVSGQCSFEVTHPTKLIKISAVLKGVATVRWSESERVNNGRKGSTTRSKTYSASKVLFRYEQVLFQVPVGLKKQPFQPGQYQYPFLFRLPLNGLSSSFEGAYGNIRYSVKATIEKSWMFNPKVKRLITLTSPLNAGIYSGNMIRGSNTSAGLMGMNGGPVSLTAQINRQFYQPGEYIHILAHLDNGSVKTVTPKVQLIRRVTFFATTKSRGTQDKVAKLHGDGLRSGEKVNWDKKLMVPHDCTGTINDCQIIRVEYVLLVKLFVPMGSDAVVEFAVTIGTPCVLGANANQPPIAMENYHRPYPVENLEKRPPNELYPDLSNAGPIPSAPSLPGMEMHAYADMDGKF